MTLLFDYNPIEPSDREAYRTAVPGLVAKLSGFEGVFPIMDISANGLALKADDSSSMRPWQEAIVEIMSVSQKKIMRCSIRLVRVNKDNGIVGFEFINLNAFQEASLDKLVLEVQKREIQRQKILLAGPEPNQDHEPVERAEEKLEI